MHVAADQIAKLSRALPYWVPLALIPLTVVGAVHGGWTVFLLPVGAWALFILLDAITGGTEANADPSTPDESLIWYRLITLIWFPVQFTLVMWLVWYVPGAAHLALWEKLVLFVGMGIIGGTIGINYAHELMHQRTALERWLSDLILATVMYSHFRSEHLHVHHPHVGTPRDPTTSRFDESFWWFFPRVVRAYWRSSIAAEAARLARRGRTAWHISNPFWRYGVLQGACVALALSLGGWPGLGLFLLQSFVAIWQLELVNYVEHYGLTRKHLGGGKYESFLPRHSWNSTRQASNWLLINLQRHSDHHFKPDRRFPLLQVHPLQDAPQLPYGYPVMTLAAMVPPVWRRIMNPRVEAWRQRYYPEITDWRPYNQGRNPTLAWAPAAPATLGRN
ncbi:MAG: alkane 1-monooxygenase [Rhodobacter sp.]|nr:alkane 1-monooxygenase [Rhodobacter sp.]